MVGQANWLVVNGREGEGEEKEGERGLGEGAWDSLEEREFAELLYGSLMAQRNEFLGRMGGRGLGVYLPYFPSISINEEDGGYIISIMSF